MTVHPFRRMLALGVVLTLVAASMPAFSAEPGLMVGRVLASDGITPLRGVIVSLVGTTSQEVFASTPSNPNGVFEAEDTAGDYRVVAETSQGAYLASGAVRVAAGSNPPVSLTLKQAGEPTGTTPPPATPPPPSTGGQLAPWAKWVIVGGIVVAGVLVVDAVTSDDEETPSSAFVPGGSN